MSAVAAALLQFNLAALPPDLLMADIGKATIMLRVGAIGTPGAIDVHPVVAPSSWSEARVSSVHRGPRIGASTPVASGSQHIMLDVTSLVKQWIGARGNKAPNLGLMIVPSAEAPATTVEFESRERGLFSPLLDVTLFLTRGSVMLHGNGMPSNDLGEDGDMYLEAIGQQIVGPKANGVWPQTFAALAGPKGDKGEAGEVGAAGVAGPVGAAGNTGPQGLVGAVGAAGAEGPGGVAGATGPAGTAGANGATGPQGPAGASGSSAFQITHRSAPISTLTTTILCQSGEVAMGGGVTGNTYTYLQASGPVNNNGWTVTFDWYPSSSTIWVICMSTGV